MRKVLYMLLVALIALPTLATPVKTTMLKKANKGPDVQIIDLCTRNTGEAQDTMLTTDVNVYGPYNLVSAEGDPMPSTVQVWGDVTTGTTPVFAIDYQVIGSFNLADTIAAGWTSIDSLGETATNQACTISGCGKAIVFQIHNYDGTTGQIPGMVRIGIKDAKTVTVK